MPDTLDTAEFEARLRRALHELTPDLDEGRIATVHPIRRRRWVVGASIAAVAAAACAVAFAVLPDDAPGSDTPAANPSGRTVGSSAASSAPPTAACTRLEPHTGPLRVTDTNSAAMTVSLSSTGGCVLRAVPALTLQLDDVARLTVQPGANASEKLPLTIPSGGSARLEIEYGRLPTPGTQPERWQLAVRVGGNRQATTTVSFPQRPGYTPVRFTIVGAGS